jgi:hypothetical protein
MDGRLINKWRHDQPGMLQSTAQTRHGVFLKSRYPLVFGETDVGVQ